MIGCKLLGRINNALELAKECKEPFGGLNVIFCGDFAQLPSVQDPRLYANLSTARPNHTAVLGKLLWLLIDTVVFLKQPMRQTGPENARFVELLNRLRDGLCTNEDFDLLNTRLIERLPRVINSTPWAFPTTIVFDNTTKDALNIAAVQAFAHATGRALHWYYSSD
ncbi:hypothetical protein BC629DRAFT_1264823, partial [Irpex lacteus]